MLKEMIYKSMVTHNTRPSLIIRREITIAMLLLLIVTPCVISAQLNTTHYLTNGKQAINQKHYSKSIHILNTLLRYEPNHAEAFFFRGLAKFHLNDYRGALTDFNQSLKLDPYYPQGYFFRAITRDLVQDYFGALSDFKVAEKFLPNDANVYHNQGLTKLHLNNISDAIADFSHAIKLNSHNEKSYLIRGIAYEEMIQYKKALNDYNTAASIAPYNPTVHLTRGEYYFHRKAYNEAIENYNRAISLDSKLTLAYFKRSLIYTKQGDTIKALNDLDEVIKQNPYNSLAHYNKGLIHAARGEYTDALYYFNKVLVLNPNNILTLFNSVACHYQLHQYHEAIEELNKIIRIFPTNLKAYQQRGNLLLALKQTSAAEEDFNKIKQLQLREKIMIDSLSKAPQLIKKFIEFNQDFEQSSVSLSESSDQSIRSKVLFYYGIVNDSIINQYTLSKNTYNYSDPITQQSSLHIKIKSTHNTYPTAPTNSYPNLNQKDQLILYGITEIEKKNYSTAIEYFNKVLTLNPNSIIGLTNRAVAFIYQSTSINRNIVDAIHINKNSTPTLHKIPDFTKALNDLNKAILLSPKSIVARYNRAILYTYQKNLKQALTELNHIIEQEHNFGEAYYIRGLLRLNISKNEACEDLSKAGELGIEEAYSLISLYCK